MKRSGIKWARALLWCAALTLAAAVQVRSAAPPLTAVLTGPAGAEGRWPSAVLDINAAGTAALEELPEIGPALAERIVAARAENGPFAGPEALQEVSGIGPATWQAIAPFVYFGDGNTH